MYTKIMRSELLPLFLCFLYVFDKTFFFFLVPAMVKCSITERKWPTVSLATIKNYFICDSLYFERYDVYILLYIADDCAGSLRLLVRILK